MFFTSFMGMRPTLYHFYAGTSFQDWTLSFTLFFFSLCICLLPSLQETECLFGKLFLCLTINDREGSQGGGASLQE